MSDPFKPFPANQVSRDLAKAVRAWLNTEPESYKYPGPGDWEELDAMVKALEEFEESLGATS